MVQDSGKSSSICLFTFCKDKLVSMFYLFHNLAILLNNILLLLVKTKGTYFHSERIKINSEQLFKYA